MNTFTSPTEIISAMVAPSSAFAASSSKSSADGGALKSLQQKQQQMTEPNQKLEQRSTFKMKGIEMAIPYSVTVTTETADPAGAEKGAKVVVQDVFDTVGRAILSQFEPTSEISKINSSSSEEWVSLSPILGAVLQAAASAAAATDNVFAPVVVVVEEGAGSSSSGSFDEHFELKQEDRGGGSFRLRRKKLTAVAASVKLDVCAIAKGYLVDTMASRLVAAGFSSVLVDWGGEICCLGMEEKVGIMRPKNSSGGDGESTGIDFVELSNSCCATSGEFMQEEPHIRRRPAAAAASSGGKNEVASITVVHPSTATADALATYLYCEMTTNSSSSNSSTSVEARFDSVCQRVTAKCFGFGYEMQRAVLQLYTDADGKSGSTATRFVHWTNPRCVKLPMLDVPLKTTEPSSAGSSSPVLAQLRRSMCRVAAIIFARASSGCYLGATVSSSGLLALLPTQPTLSSTPPGKLFSTATLPKGMSSTALVVSVQRASRLFDLMCTSSGSTGSSPPEEQQQKQQEQPSLYVLLPRLPTALPKEDTEAEYQQLISKLNRFAAGATVTAEELQQQEAADLNLVPCTLLAAEGVVPVTAGTHGVFALRAHLEDKLLKKAAAAASVDLNSHLAASLPLIRAGRGYAVAAAPSPSQLAGPRLYPGGPTTCAVATRLVRGQFFGCTVQHVDFVSLAGPAADAPVLQVVVPVHSLSLAAFENFNNLNQMMLKLHFFSGHDDAVSLLNWFSDPSFMTGARTEHFLYLPSAATAEEEHKYEFPGTAGKAGALFTVMCDVVHISNLTLLPGGAGAPACLLLVQARPGSAKAFAPPQKQDSSNSVALTWA